jgi:hypothetical protein
MQRRRRIPRLPLLVAALALAGCGGASAPALPALAIDPAAVSVSGISSGAYMAHQAHLAFSDRVVGAALLAGGPYQCAGGALDIALKHCVAPEQPPDVAPLARRPVRWRRWPGSPAIACGSTTARSTPRSARA